MKNKHPLKKVVLDTNVFINGWFGDNVYCQIIMDWIDKRFFYLAFGQDTIGELIYMVKNFARYNIADRKQQLELIKKVSELFYYASSVNTIDTAFESTNDSYDDMFLKCAIEGKVDYLVTDDFKSGMHEKEYNFKVLSSEDFVKEYTGILNT